MLLGGAVSAAASRGGLLGESIALYFLQALGPSSVGTLHKTSPCTLCC